MKQLPFPLTKFLNILAVLLPFLGCWILFYEPRTLTANSRQVSVLAMFAFCVSYYYFCHVLDGFRTSILRIGEIIMSQALAALIVRACSCSSGCCPSISPIRCRSWAR